MVHVLPETVELILAESTGRLGRLPLFVRPVISDDIAAGSLRHLHAALRNGTPLELDERLASAVLALARSASTAATRMPALDRVPAPAAAQVAGRVRALIDEAFAEDLGAAELAAAAGCSRYRSWPMRSRKSPPRLDNKMAPSMAGAQTISPSRTRATCSWIG